MSNIKDSIKKNRFIKKLRTNKWKRISSSFLFDRKKTEYLLKHPEKIHEEVYRTLSESSDHGRELLEKLEFDLSRSEAANKKDIDLEKLKDEMLFWYYAYGYTFREFLGYDFMNLDFDQRRERYLSEREALAVEYDVNDIDAMQLLNDKSKTYDFLKEYFKRDSIVIASEADYDKFKQFTDKYPAFVKKDPFESGGRGIEIFDLSKEKQDLHELFTHLMENGKVHLEEYVIQDGIMKMIHEKSVNTVRCITFNLKDGIIAPYFMVRCGQGDMIVDNSGAGGIFVEIEPETGILGFATDEFGNMYDVHPDSGFRFRGAQIPEWNKMLSICKEMAAKLPAIRFIGWDMAYAKDKGWVLIEGNSMPGISGPQAINFGIKKEINEICSKMDLD